MAQVRDQAICIRHWDWSETSQTVSLFARELGVVRAVAKGAKREKANFSGGLEVATRGEMLAIVKPSDTLANLTAWDLQEVFPALRRKLSIFYAGMYLLDLVQQNIRDHDPHPALFDALLEALRATEAGEESARAAVLWFQWRTLVETGIAPELDRASGEGGVVGFSARSGGVVPAPRGAEAGVQRVRAETIAALGEVSRAAGPGDVMARAETLRRACGLLAWYVREMVGAESAAAEMFLRTLPAGVSERPR
ncbi:MAG: DNA repair protein RecO [Planctomycetota bacterium]|nr:DNA repair protein RecO [Planctomycetota bacterium]